MRTQITPFVLAVVLVACGGDPDQSGSTGPRPLPRKFTLAGVVRDQAGVVAGARIRLSNSLTPERATTSNLDGFFAFPDVFGKVALLVTKANYLQASTEVMVVSDLLIEIPLTRAEPALILPLGEVVHSELSGKEPPCDPAWDARAPCRRFNITPPYAGTLFLEVTWNGEVELDVVIIAPDGQDVGYSSGFSRIAVSAPVEGQQIYEVRVQSYYSGQAFDLKAYLQP